MMVLLRYILPFFLLMFSVVVFATHIRAIEITAKRIGPNQYQFTVTGYRDVDGVNFSNGTFSFGDGNSLPNATNPTIPWQVIGLVGNDTEKVRFIVNHTYAGPGAYRVSYQESYRNDGIVNMSNSVGTDYYSETLLILDPLVGINNTPILTVPPIDIAAKGLIFIHNPGAFDEDGDSLSYRFSIPQQGRSLQVTGYRSMIDPGFYPDGFSTGNEADNGPPTLTLDPVTGDLIWDSPGMAGEYNVAFIVEEWRKINGVYFRLGYVTRDMQILVEDTDNNPPELTPPNELCVSAGTFIDDSVYDPDITGTDPDGHPVTLSAFGGPFEAFAIDRRAYYTPNPPTAQGPPGVLRFFWQTDCQHIRERPYEIRLKIEDNPPIVNGLRTAPKLVDFETWNITVVGPAPEGLITTALPSRRMQVEWNEYACENSGATMQVWRRVGSFDFTPDECELGIPANSGYELVATLPITQNVFIDTNGGLGLAPGANYCYRLVAKFPDPTGGTSYASEESCTELEAIVPMITKVDITGTSATSGTVRVEWIEPLDLDVNMFPGPYTYDVLRATGKTANSTSFTTVATGLTDKFFNDNGLNTEDNAYSYIIRMYDSTPTRIDDSFAASSVRLELVPQVAAMRVNWSAMVPWSNSNTQFPIHEIYRNRVNADPTEMVLIATVNVTQSGFTYLDDGNHNGVPLDEDLFYCYLVRTQGSYDNTDPSVPEPLINNSQIQCAQPNDEDPPCTPINLEFDEAFSCENQLDQLGSCDIDVYTNRLLWEENMNSECDDDVVSFNLYFSATGADDSYALLANTTNYFFEHTGLSSFKGCYIIAAVDRSGNESVRSEPLCQENCIINDGNELGYKLPNVFTPNGDGINDTFRAFGDNDPESCPRFVLSVAFLVIDRTGKELYRFNSREAENDIYINWNGKNNNGKDLPAGTYFYSCVVTFDTLDPKLAVQKLNGWVQIIR